MRSFIGPVALTIAAVGILALIVRILILALPDPREVARPGAQVSGGGGEAVEKGQPAKATRPSPNATVRAPSGSLFLPRTEATRQDFAAGMNAEEPMVVLETFAGVPGEEEFERQLAELLETTDIKMHDQDPLADVADQAEQASAAGVNAEGPVQEPVVVFETFAGVPGEEMFETRLREFLEESDSQIHNDPLLETE